MAEGYLEAYVTSRKLAKDLCFAMALAYPCRDVCVTQVRGMGWHVDCTTTTPSESARDTVMAIFGRNREGSVNWL